MVGKRGSGPLQPGNTCIVSVLTVLFLEFSLILKIQNFQTDAVLVFLCGEGLSQGLDKADKSEAIGLSQCPFHTVLLHAGSPLLVCSDLLMAAGMKGHHQLHLISPVLSSGVRPGL